MTGISDEAVSDFDDAEATARVIGLRQGLRGWALRQHEVRAGLAAALPHLADACDALRAAERSRVSTPTPKPITAAHGDLSGPHGASRRRDAPGNGTRSAVQPRTAGDSPAASPHHPDAAQTDTAARNHKLRINGPDQYGYYRGRCACGWPGSPWENRRDVRAEYDRHLTADSTQED